MNEPFVCCHMFCSNICGEQYINRHKSYIHLLVTDEVEIDNLLLHAGIEVKVFYVIVFSTVVHQ